MHIFSMTIGALFLLATAVSPFYFSFRNKNLLVCLVKGVTAAAVLTAGLAWWGAVSIELRLWWLGVDFEGMSVSERTANVAPELQDYAEDLMFSPARMGIGWPLKAILAFTHFVLPYVCLASIGTWCARQLFSKLS